MRSFLIPAALAIGALGAFAWYGSRDRDAVTTLRFSSGSETGEYHDFATALATVAGQRDAGLAIEVLPSAGAVENAERLSAGVADLGIIQSDTQAPASVRAIASIFPETLHIVARTDSGVETVADVAGKRVALMPKGSGGNAVFARLMAHYGLDEGDYAISHLPPSEAMAALRAGEVDVMARVIALGNGPMRDLLRDPGLRLVPLDQAEAIQMFAPALRRIEIPRGALNGWPPVPPQSIEALGVDAILVAGAQVPEADVRRLTELMFGARNLLVELDEQTAFLGAGESPEVFGLALHPGARAYFEADKPQFLVEYTDQIALGLTIAALAASAIWQAKSWIEQRQKNRSDAYNETMVTLIDELRGPVTPDRLAEIEATVFDVLRRTLDDIDHDRLAPEMLPAFDLLWRAAGGLISARRTQIAAAGAAFDTAPFSAGPIGASPGTATPERLGLRA
jgi:TRAP transporter TAXI family solute receptor